jgi:uncharacterized OB-fold protein
VSTEPLIGSRCGACDNVAFPPARGCQQCGSQEINEVELARQGHVWAYTVQRFAPKSPPFVVPEGGFKPFAVGYVHLEPGVKVEGILECDDFDQLEGNALVELRTTEPVPHFRVAAKGA